MAKTGTKAPAKKAGKAKPAPEPEELEDDAELEELEEDTVEEAAPKKKGGAQAEITFGVQDIVKHLEKAGHKVNARGLRTLIRKMARDDSGRVAREIVAGNRTRYDWPKGLKDPEVKRIIAAFEAGELEEDKKEKLAALKANKAKKDKEAGKVKGGKKAGKGKAAKPAPVEEDDDEELELDDDE